MHKFDIFLIGDISVSVKMFVSFASEDIEFIELLASEIQEKFPDIEPQIIEHKKDAGIDFQKQVFTRLESCNWFFVLLTEKSITNQWVNQELGFAFSLYRRGDIKKIIPIVERKSIKRRYEIINLKGFIHKEVESAVFIRENIQESIQNVIEYLKVCLKEAKKPETQILKDEAKKFKEDGLLYEAGTTLQRAATILIKENNPKEATGLLKEAIEILKKGLYNWETAEAKAQLAEIHINESKYKEALVEIEESANLYSESRNDWEAAEALERGGDIAFEEKLVKDANKFFTKARDLYRKRGYNYEAKRCLKKIKEIDGAKK